MKRSRLIAVLVGFMAIVAFASNASAMYDPALGRFLQRDPGADGAMSPVRTGQYHDGMNVYQYVQCNPTHFTDPSGLQVYVYLSTKSDWKERDDFAGKVKEAFQAVIGKCGTVDYDVVNNETSGKLAVYKITEDKSKSKECKCEKCFEVLKNALESKEQNVHIDMNKGNEAKTDTEKGGYGSITTIDPNLNQKFYEIDPKGGDDIATPMRFDVALWHEAIGHGFLLKDHSVGNEDSFTKDFENGLVRDCLRETGVDIRDRILDYHKSGPVKDKK
jgi:RHS repeat-associated protein